MKLLKHYNHATEADDSAELEQRGIPTHVGAKYSQSLSGLYTGALKARLWILLDEQYEDAYNFLNNPKHKITTGIHQQEIQRLRAWAKPRVYEALNMALVYGVILALVLLFIFLKIDTENI